MLHSAAGQYRDLFPETKDSKKAPEAGAFFAEGSFTMFRIGQSIDIHPLQDGRRLVLGGVEIDSPKGLAGHSDADVLIHAVAESILGALALGDLGAHFPDTDPKYKDISSMILLEHVYILMKDNGYRLGNIDATVLAEKPKLAAYIEQMRANLARCLHCEISQVSIKATRGEKLGFVGRQEGMAALCVCLLESQENAETRDREEAGLESKAQNSPEKAAESLPAKEQA